MPQTSCAQTRSLRVAPEGEKHSPKETKGAEKSLKFIVFFIVPFYGLRPLNSAATLSLMSASSTVSAAYPIASGNSKQSNPDGLQQAASGAPQSRQAAEDA